MYFKIILGKKIGYQTKQVFVENLFKIKKVVLKIMHKKYKSFPKILHHFYTRTVSGNKIIGRLTVSSKMEVAVLRAWYFEF